MTQAERAETEARADRLLRRGELADAAALYERLLTAFPGDPVLEGKLSELRDSVGPAELHAARARLAAPPAAAKVRGPLSPELEGEELFARGDYVNAAAAFRRALKERPDNELLKERLLEVFALAQAQQPGARQPRPASAPAASPPPPAASPAPRAAPEDVLRSLLGRIADRKRSP